MTQKIWGAIRFAMIAGPVGLSFANSGICADSPEKQPTVQNTARGVCADIEKTDFRVALPGTFKTEFDRFLDGKNSPARNFSEALSLRRAAKNLESKILSEYWISRSLLNAKMVHIAHSGLSVLASIPPNDTAIGVQLASLDCLNQLYKRYPSIPYPNGVVAHLGKYFEYELTPKQKEVLWKTTENLIEVNLSEGKSKDSFKRLIGYMEGAGIRQARLLGLEAASRNDHAGVITQIEGVLNNENLNSAYAHSTDQLRLILARSYYALGDQEKAVGQLNKIKKSSNELATALSELAWSYLLQEKYSEAIGASFSLQAGGLRHTFAPEGPMVMAMALNEICQFPESLKAVRIFKKNYEKPYHWLSHWYHDEKAAKAGLYPLAIQYLKKTGKTVPERVASEWVKSPLFISSQDEINLLLDESKYSLDLSHSAMAEQRKLATEIKAAAKTLKAKMKSERSKLKTYVNSLEILSPTLQAEIEDLKEKVLHFRRFRGAAPTWRNILGRYQKTAVAMKQKLLNRINEQIAENNIRMLHQLEEVAENNEFIEVEIYNGASQDVIWQNAHPDYKEISAKIKEDEGRVTKEKVWNWGKASYGATDDADDSFEIWEDEVGSFKADLYDNCSSKDKYMAIKLKHS